MSNSLLEASGWGEVKGGDEISTGFTNEYEEFNEQDHYGSISYAKEELKAEAISTRYSRSEPPDLDIAVTAQSTFVPLQLKDCWKKKSCTAVLLALAGGCLLLSIVLFSQAVFSELRKLNTRISSQESVDPSTISRMIQELNSSLITELRILEERISKRSEATDKNVSKQISRLEENMKSSLRDLKAPTGTSNSCARLLWKEFQGHQYYFSETEEDWGKAREICLAANTSLLVISNQQEQDFVVSQMSSSIWLGLSDIAEEKIWRWVDGSPLRETFWRRGEPNNSGDEDCAVLYKEKNWNDIPCSRKVHFVCEKK